MLSIVLLTHNIEHICALFFLCVWKGPYDSEQNTFSLVLCDSEMFE